MTYNVFGGTSVQFILTLYSDDCTGMLRHCCIVIIVNVLSVVILMAADPYASKAIMFYLCSFFYKLRPQRTPDGTEPNFLAY